MGFNVEVPKYTPVCLFLYLYKLIIIEPDENVNILYPEFKF